LSGASIAKDPEIPEDDYIGSYMQPDGEILHHDRNVSSIEMYEGRGNSSSFQEVV